MFETHITPGPKNRVGSARKQTSRLFIIPTMWTV